MYRTAAECRLDAARAASEEQALSASLSAGKDEKPRSHHGSLDVSDASNDNPSSRHVSSPVSPRPFALRDMASTRSTIHREDRPPECDFPRDRESRSQTA